MKKNALKKLSLHRETLRSLGQDLLSYAVGADKLSVKLPRSVTKR